MRTRTIHRRANDPFMCGKCVAGEPAATVRDHQQTRLRRSGPQCQPRPTATERAALPLLLLSSRVVNTTSAPVRAGIMVTVGEVVVVASHFDQLGAPLPPKCPRQIRCQSIVTNVMTHA